MHIILSIVSVLCLFSSCASASSLKKDSLKADQLLRIQQLTSVFENSSVRFNYSYVQNLHDGRGYTAGRAGFCTGTGDLLPVVEKYTKLNPGNPLQKFIKELRRLSELSGHAAADVHGLVGFVKAWKASAKDKVFREVQDQEVMRVYLKPAIRKANALHVHFALTIGMIFDTFIQNGPDGGADGALTIINETNLAAGMLDQGADEKVWLKTFLKIRANHLLNAADPETREEWKNSVGRVYVYEDLVNQNYWDFDAPVNVTFYGQDFLIP